MGRWAEQLRSAKAEVDGFEFSGLIKTDRLPVKDLNDFLLGDLALSRCTPETFYGVFDFAMERQG